MENTIAKYAELNLEEKPRIQPKTAMTEAEQIEQIRREINAIRNKHAHVLSEDRSLDFARAMRIKEANMTYAKRVYNRTSATCRHKILADEKMVQKRFANPLSKYQSTQTAQGLVPLEESDQKRTITRAPIQVPKRKAYTVKLLSRRMNPDRRG